MIETAAPEETIDLAGRAPGRPLRVVLLAFYNFEAHAIRIFHPLLKRRGHDVHSIFFKNYFTFQVPTQQEEDMLVDLIERLQPDLVAMSVWSTYYQLAARISRRLRQSLDTVIIWGGIHPQTRSEDCLQHADLVARSEGEYVLAELTDRLSLGQDWTDIAGTWSRRDGEIRRNPPRLLIQDLDVLPPADLSPANKYYLGWGAWRDVARWDKRAICYDVMGVRGCPFECTFCIHNYTRKVTQGLGTYIRRRSVEHVLSELRTAVAERPLLKMVAFSDDIFSPPRPWLDEFCERYPREVNLPFLIWTFPRMVDDEKIRKLNKAGLWCATMGIQSGSERIRRECYERETSNEEIVAACQTLARHRVARNLDFIGDNPWETEEDWRETLGLLCRLPKPFYFNYFSLTYFPGVDITERALAAGFITPDDVEDVAQKGYHLWGGALFAGRSPEALKWDIAYQLAIQRVPRPLIEALMRTRVFNRNLRRIADGIVKWGAMFRRLSGRTTLADDWAKNTVRDLSAGMSTDDIQPNVGSSPLRVPPRLQVDPAA